MAHANAAFGTLVVLALLAGMAHSVATETISSDNKVIEVKVVYDEAAEGAFGLELPRGAKSRWPELVGKTFAEAQEVILSEAPNVRVSKVTAGSAVTADYSLQRVRVVVSDDGKDVVVREPRRG